MRSGDSAGAPRKAKASRVLGDPSAAAITPPASHTWSRKTAYHLGCSRIETGCPVSCGQCYSTVTCRVLSHGSGAEYALSCKLQTGGQTCCKCYHSEDWRLQPIDCTGFAAKDRHRWVPCEICMCYIYLAPPARACASSIV